MHHSMYSPFKVTGHCSVHICFSVFLILYAQLENTPKQFVVVGEYAKTI
jgi:hypothetical protein